jgi:hypothetical protein
MVMAQATCDRILTTVMGYTEFRIVNSSTWFGGSFSDL